METKSAKTALWLVANLITGKASLDSLSDLYIHVKATFFLQKQSDHDDKGGTLKEERHRPGVLWNKQQPEIAPLSSTNSSPSEHPNTILDLIITKSCHKKSWKRHCSFLGGLLSTHVLLCRCTAWNIGASPVFLKTQTLIYALLTFYVPKLDLLSQCCSDSI